jgi:hypothetical protein
LERKRAARSRTPAIVARARSRRQLRLRRAPRRAGSGSNRAARAAPHRAAEPGRLEAGGIQQPPPPHRADFPDPPRWTAAARRRGVSRHPRQPLENKTARAAVMPGGPLRVRSRAARNVDCQTEAELGEHASRARCPRRRHPSRSTSSRMENGRGKNVRAHQGGSLRPRRIRRRKCAGRSFRVVPHSLRLQQVLPQHPGAHGRGSVAGGWTADRVPLFARPASVPSSSISTRLPVGCDGTQMPA